MPLAVAFPQVPLVLIIAYVHFLHSGKQLDFIYFLCRTTSLHPQEGKEGLLEVTMPGDCDHLSPLPLWGCGDQPWTQ